MKKAIIAMLAILLAIASLSAQVRIDLGMALPVIAYDFLLPDLGVHYQFGAGGIKLGIGLRGTSALVTSALVPNLFLEYGIGKCALEAQLGGGLSAFYSDFQGKSYGVTVFPCALVDLSLWRVIGKRRALRIGAGVLGAIDVHAFSAMPIPYIAGKISTVL